MSKSQNAKKGTTATVATETPVVTMPAVKPVAEVVNVTTEMLGRPVDPNSARQKRLAELNTKRADPSFKLGRPSNPNSKHAIAKAAEAARKADPNYKSQQGRPIDLTSPRQIKLAEQAVRKANRIAAAMTNGNINAVVIGDKAIEITTTVKEVELV